MSMLLGVIDGFSEVVLWRIDDFLSVQKEFKIKEFIESPPFSLVGCKWYLSIFPQGDKTDGYISVYLHKHDPEVTTKTVCFSLGIKSFEGIAFERPSGTCTFNEKKSRWGYPSFWKVSEAWKRRLDLLPSGALIITCRVGREMSTSKDVAPNPGKVDPQREVFAGLCRRHFSLEALSSDLKDLLSSERKYDVTLSVQGKDFRAHRIVLAARSPVFRAMYDHDTAEAKTGLLTIPDCDPESFGDFLTYVYTGRIDLNSVSTQCHLQRMCQLYATAEKYDLQQLKSLSADYMTQNMTAENVCDIVILADRFCDDRLTSCGQDFFNRNYCKILLTTEWKDMMKNNVRIADKLLSEMASAIASKNP